MRIARRGRRSTITPAGSVKRMNGRNSTVLSAATWNALACRPRTAARGRASSETCEPSSLIDCPAQSLRKSACRQRPPRGRKRRVFSATRGLGRMEADDELMGRAADGVETLEVGDEPVEPALELACVRGGEARRDRLRLRALLVLEDEEPGDPSVVLLGDGA